MANGYQGFDPHRWERSMQTTMQKLLRDVEDAAMRNYQMMALLNSAGRVTLGHGGEGISWPVKYKHHRAEGATGENVRNFRPTNLWKTAHQEYRGYEVTDSIKRKEVSKNKGDAAIIKVIDGFMDRLRESLIHELGPQFYTDGSTAANEQFWHGLQTLIQTDGNTINSSTGDKRAKDPSDKVAYVEGTNFAGLDMELGAYGGSQDSGVPWPEGKANSEYDFWTPLIVNRESTDFDNTSTGVEVEQAMRYAITHGQRNSDQQGQITNMWIDRTLFIALANHYQSKQTIEVTNPHSLVSLGFRNVIRFDGIEVSWEAATPVGYGFGVNINNIELLGLEDELYVSEGPEYDINTQSFNAVVSTLSNFKYRSPRNFCILMPYADI